MNRQTCTDKDTYIVTGGAKESASLEVRSDGSHGRGFLVLFFQVANV